MGRPRSTDYYRYGGIHTLSQTLVTGGTMLSMAIAAPSDSDEEIFFLGYNVRVDLANGSAGRINFQSQDGNLVWADGLGESKAWSNANFTLPGVPLGKQGAGGAVIASCEGLSSGELWVHYRYM